jgi:Tryptophan RNA-binding attenuator protein inhibitory protein
MSSDFVDSLTSVELEEPCASCGGQRGEMELGNWYPCPICEGAGYVPTRFGKKILDLLKHNFNPLLRAATID